MNKELIKLGPIPHSKRVNFSNWRVDEAIRIPIRKAPAPVPFLSSNRLNRLFLQRASFTKRLGALAVLLLALCLGPSVNASQSVSLAWNPSTDSGTTGYIVYAGSASGSYTAQLDVGTNTTITLTGLREGNTNYFAVSSYNAAKVPGTPSSEISFIVPGLITMTPNTASAPRLNFATAPGHWYELQASADMNHWATIWQTPTATTNTWVGYQDNQASSYTKRFYRLVMH